MTPACSVKPMLRKLTLTLDDGLFLKLRVLAARRQRSVSAMLREVLSRLVAEDEAYAAAKLAALRRLKRGTRLGGGPLPSRGALHERGHPCSYVTTASPLRQGA